MNNIDFRIYQKKMIKTFELIIQGKRLGDVDEQGLPSYTNPNSLMRWLVWERIRKTISLIDTLGEFQNVLDFGCGYGVFHPYIIEKSEKLVAHDLMIEDLIALERMTEEKGHSKIVYETDFSLIAKRKNYFSLIIASEVLEHVDNIDELCDVFYEILENKGSLIVSGPTENGIYKLGRKLAGYSGDYHVRNVYQIRDILQKRFEIKKTITLFPLFPIYEIYLLIKI